MTNTYQLKTENIALPMQPELIEQRFPWSRSVTVSLKTYISTVQSQGSAPNELCVCQRSNTYQSRLYNTVPDNSHVKIKQC